MKNQTGHFITQRLAGLLQSPSEHWLVIREEYLPSVRSIVQRYYLWFFLAMIPTFFIGALLRGNSLKRSLLMGGLTPLMLAVLLFVLFYLISLIVEETTELFSIPITPSMGAKLTFFSAFPLVVSLPLLPIPYAGPILSSIFFLYMFFLFYLGSERLLGLNGTKRFFWLLSIVVASMLVFFLLAAVMLILTFLLNLFI